MNEGLGHARSAVNEMEHRRTSPLDVAGVDLDISTDEIVRIVAEGRRSKLPVVEIAASGRPIPALSADELAAIVADEYLGKHKAAR